MTTSVVELLWHPNPGAEPSSKQAAAVQDLDHFLLSMCGGYGSGKTHTAAFKCIEYSAFNPGLWIGAVGQTLKATKQDLIPAIREILFCSGIGHNYNRTDFVIKIPKWRGRIQVVSAHDPDLLKGQNWAAAVGNEPGIWPHDSFRNLLARVRDPRASVSQIFLAGTPEGFNWFYKETVKKYPKAHLGEDPYCRVIFTSSHDATWLGPDYVKRLEDAYPDDLLDEKVKGRFVAVGEGRIYPAFDRSLHSKTLEWNKDLPLVLALDFNIAPAVAVINQHYPHPSLEKVIYSLDEIHISRGTVRNVIDEFTRRYPVTQVDLIGDATGKAKHATGQSCYDEVFSALRDHGVEFSNRTPLSNPPTADRYAIVNGAIQKGRYFVHPRCVNLIEDFEQVQYKPGTRLADKAKDGGRYTHLTDAMGYDLHDTFGGSKVSGRAEVARKKESRPWDNRRVMREAPWRQ